MTRRRWAFLALALLPLLALACGETYTSGGYRTSPVATSTPTLGGIAGAYFEAEQAENRLQAAADLATLQAAQSQATLNAAASDASAAQEWVDAQATATTQAINNYATLVYLDVYTAAQLAALGSTRTAEAQFATATAQAGFEHATATAQAEATRATATTVSGQATATAAAQFATATTQAEQTTATAESYRAGQTTTVDAHHWGQTLTAEAITATAEARVARREQVTEPLRTWGPWLFAVLAVAGVGFLGYRAFAVWELRKRAIPRDPRGDAPLMMLQMRGGGLVLYDPDRSWGPATVIDAQVSQPSLAPAEYQERTTARDQAVDLTTRGLTGKPAQPRRRLPQAVMRPAPPPVAGPQIRLVPPERVLPWIEEVQGQLIEGGNE